MTEPELRELREHVATTRRVVKTAMGQLRAASVFLARLDEHLDTHGAELTAHKEAQHHGTSTEDPAPAREHSLV